MFSFHFMSMVLIFPFLFRFVCFRCFIRPFISSKVEKILKFSVSSLLFYPPNRLFLSYLNVVTCVNGILHKRLVCYTSYFSLGCLLGFAPQESDIKGIYRIQKQKILFTWVQWLCCLLPPWLSCPSRLRQYCKQLHSLFPCRPLNSTMIENSLMRVNSC